jgi:lipid-binding SYLF domain-containing protein
MGRLIQTAFALICLFCLAPAGQAREFDGTTEAQIDTDADAALSNLYASVPGSQGVISRAAGVLVFPRSGFIVGGQHGGGALRVGGNSVGYYYTDRMTYDVNPSARNHAVAIVFMTKEALQRLQASTDWNVGADASVAVVKAGAGGMAAASQPDKPVQIFVFGDNGLVDPTAMAGAKITKVG